MRNTGKLKSSKQLKSGGALGGGDPIASSKSLSANTRLKARSKKMQKTYEEERIPFVIDFLERYPHCQLRLLVSTPDGKVLSACTGLSEDVHEVVPRGRGGNIVPIEGDESNFAATCRHCHSWVTANPKEARRLGYTR
jgi:hypothetical protein